MGDNANKAPATNDARRLIPPREGPMMRIMASAAHAPAADNDRKPASDDPKSEHQSLLAE